MPVESLNNNNNSKRYKTSEQVEIAKQTIDLLQDYVELAKTESKLKDKGNKLALQKQIDVTNETIFANVKEL